MFSSACWFSVDLFWYMSMFPFAARFNLCTQAWFAYMILTQPYRYSCGIPKLPGATCKFRRDMCSRTQFRKYSDQRCYCRECVLRSLINCCHVFLEVCYTLLPPVSDWSIFSHFLWCIIRIRFKTQDTQFSSWRCTLAKCCWHCSCHLMAPNPICEYISEVLCW